MIKTQYYPQSSCDSCTQYCQPKAFKHSVEPQVARKSWDMDIDVLSNLEYQYRAGNLPLGTPGPFISTDPRLRAPASGIKQCIDQPPLQCNINMFNLDKNTCSTGNRWKSYNDIDLGDIVYYNDTSIEDTLFPPLFSQEASVEGVMYKDPMGSVKPQYTRCPLPIEDDAQNPLSWIRDSQEHRQDLMSLQMRKQNQSRWAPLYTPQNPKPFNVNSWDKDECIYK